MSRSDLNYYGVIFGVVGIGYALIVSAKADKLCKKIDKTVDNASSLINVDIPNKLIEQAVEKAVDREVSSAVEYAAHRAVKAVKADIHEQVKAAVDSAYKDIKESVSAEVAKEVANIDMKRLSKDVTAQAEQKIIDKFDDNLDELLEKFNHELSSVSKIYKSISDAMARNNDKETYLKIS